MLSPEKIYNYAEVILAGHTDIEEEISAQTVLPHQVEVHLPPRGQKLCWLECPYCYGTNHTISDKKWISQERLVELMKEMGEYPKGAGVGKGVKKLIFGGLFSDPLNSDTAEAVIAEAKSQDMVIGIHTKLLVLSDRLVDIVCKDVREGDYLSVSIDAGNTESYNAVHGINSGDLYHRVLENIQRIVKKGKCYPDSPRLRVAATYILDERNCAQQTLEAALKDLEAVGADYVRFSLPALPLHNEQSDKPYMLVSGKSLNRAQAFLLRRKEQQKDRLKVVYCEYPHEASDKSFRERVLPCYARWVFPTIGTDGHLYPCCHTASEEFSELRIADLKVKGFWESYLAYRYPEDTLAMQYSQCKCDRKALAVNNRINQTLLQIRTHRNREYSEVGV